MTTTTCTTAERIDRADRWHHHLRNNTPPSTFEVLEAAEWVTGITGLTPVWLTS